MCVREFLQESMCIVHGAVVCTMEFVQENMCKLVCTREFVQVCVCNRDDV